MLLQGRVDIGIIFGKDLAKTKLGFFYILAIEKTVFRATIIVAGTNSANNAAKVEVTASPMPMPIKDPVTLSIPNLLTITNIAPANKKVCESFPVTFKNPTIIPKRTKMAYISALYAVIAGIDIRVVDNPIMIAKMTPIKNAHAPMEFSFDLSPMIFFYR